MGGFIGRKHELSLLKKAYDNGSNMILVTGRRRIGKTRLLKEFMKGKESTYFLATGTTEKDMLEEFWSSVTENSDQIGRPRDWKDAFSAVTRDGKRKLLIIDEFQYMIKMDESFLIRFQGIFDEILKDSGVLTILCGSHRHVMQELSDDYDSPLYGRFDRRIILRPLDFFTIPGNDLKEDIERYAVHGGVPRYMECLDDGSVRDNVQENIMDPSSLMFEDALVQLGSDVGPSSVYQSIVKAISRGNHRISEISSALETPSSTLVQYIQRLMETGILVKEIPVTETNTENSKKGRYCIGDASMEFWFRFIYPYRSDLMRGYDAQAMRHFDEGFIQDFVSFLFEDICRNAIRIEPELIGFLPERIGRYWDKRMEVDVVAINDTEKKVFLGECKYKMNSPVDRHKLNELRSKSLMIPEIEGYDIIYGLFSISGFTEDLIDDDVILIGENELNSIRKKQVSM